MKKLLIVLAAFTTITVTACNNTDNKKKNSEVSMAKDSGTADENKQAATPKPASLNEVTQHYLALKNALANDNGKEAATHGKALLDALNKIDTSSLNAEQKKVFDDAGDDAKEHAEHTSMNAEKIAHQREHFDMLSKDMYDLVKAFGTQQTLYKDHCPMYNNNKGADWLSETKEIKNPYLGKKMPTCGTVKETIK